MSVSLSVGGNDVGSKLGLMTWHCDQRALFGAARVGSAHDSCTRGDGFGAADGGCWSGAPSREVPIVAEEEVNNRDGGGESETARRGVTPAASVSGAVRPASGDVVPSLAPSSAPARSGLVLVALIAVAAVANLNLSVANVALPSIGRAFNSSQTALDLIA